MTDHFLEPAGSERDQVIAVVRSLVNLLTTYKVLSKAEWLTERLKTLEDSASSSGSVAGAFRDLHGVVLGMGGLMDLHLESPSQDESEEANAELDRLADQLYELTR